MAQIRSTTRKRRSALEKAGDSIYQYGPGNTPSTQARAGMYFVKVQNGRSETGAQLYKRMGPFPETAEGLAAAIAARDKHLADQKEQRKEALPLGRAAKAMTLEAWVEHWLLLVRSEQSASTLDHYTRVMRKHVLPHLGKLALVDLTKTRIEKWREERLEETGPEAVNDSLKRLKTALQAATNDEATTGLKLNPARYVKLVPSDDQEDDYQGDPTDVPRLVAACGESYLAALPQVATDAGLRRSEIAALRWSDVDWDNRRLALRWHYTKTITPKTATSKSITTEAFRPGTKSSKGKTEYVELSQYSIDALRQARERLRLHKLAIGKAWKAGHVDHVFYSKGQRDRSGTSYVVPTDPGADEALVFPQRDGTPFGTDQMAYWFRGITAKAGITKTLHGMRHDCGSFLLANNVPLPAVSKHMRHANTAITAQIYSHMLPKDARLGANTFDTLWASLDAQEQAV